MIIRMMTSASWQGCWQLDSHGRANFQRWEKRLSSGVNIKKNKVFNTWLNSGKVSFAD